MTKEERIEMLEQAMQMVEEAQQMVEEAINSPHIGTAHYHAYGRYGFDQLLKNGNPYDSGLQDLIDELSEDWVDEGEESNSDEL